MFWIICSIISCISLKWTYGKNNDNSIKDIFIANIIITMVFVVISIIQFGIGVDNYPSLASDLAGIQALEKRIEDIRASSYNYEKEGKFVAGSIENYQQSTNLSKYISGLATKESYYSSALKQAKVYKEIFPLYFFSHGWAISDKVYELPILEGVK